MVLVALAACSKQPETLPASEQVEATFTVSAQAPATKAFSDGTTATELVVAAYRYEGGTTADKLLYLENVSRTTTINLTTTVTLKLIKGESYEIVFWAQKPGNAYYTIDTAAKTVTVANTGNANDEARDAFYKVYSTGKVTAAITETVELRRPFAQINVLTTNEDWQAAVDNKVTFAGSSMSVKAPTVMDLISGAASVPKTYTFSKKDIVSASPNVPGYTDTHKYIAMNYILAGTAKAVETVSFSVFKTNLDEALYTWNVTSVPFQRNYRTNIVGDIFSVDGQFNVTIVPEYAEPDYTQNL
jgi:hypothetical protein